MLVIWVGAGVYLAVSFWWRRRPAGRDLGEETEAFLAGYARGQEAFDQGLSEEEVLARAREESARWWRNRRRRK